MQSTAQSPSLIPQWQELTLAKVPEPAQLENIKAELDLVFLALEALAGIGNNAMLLAAAQLNLESRVPDLVEEWRLRQSNSLRPREGEQKKLDLQEARALVLIGSTLAKQHQEKIRRAVALLEQVAEENREPHKAAVLGDYLHTFSKIYQRRSDDKNISTDVLHHLALKLLIELLFYSGSGGHRRLWLTLLDRSEKGVGVKVS